MEKGQRVLVWSLQSFSGGGFLKGAPAFVRQSSRGDDSVLLCVCRNIGGKIVIDERYEVYKQQVVMVDDNSWPADKRLVKFRETIMKES